jgi:hypothetical protein
MTVIGFVLLGLGLLVAALCALADPLLLSRGGYGGRHD